jgi:hypothetical protein
MALHPPELPVIPPDTDPAPARREMNLAGTSWSTDSAARTVEVAGSTGGVA